MENQRFEFTYSAKEQEEIQSIRSKYLLPEEAEDKMEQLRRLDAAVTQKATMLSLVVGIVGALIMGFGMSLTMSALPELLGLSATFATVLGIVIGLAGMVPVCLAYPLYNRTLKKERERIAPQILRLTDELLK